MGCEVLVDENIIQWYFKHKNEIKVYARMMTNFDLKTEDIYPMVKQIYTKTTLNFRQPFKIITGM